MNKSISMDEIAKVFNVSKVTVSKALNDKPGVGDELRSEIKKKAQEMGYRLNSAARSLKTNKSYNIGILIAERYIGEDSSYYFGVCGKLTSKLTNLGYSSIMETLTDDNETNLVLPKMYLDSKVDGIIILGQLNHDYLKMFVEVSIPVIFFDFYISDIDIDSVVIDNYYSGFEITNLLVKNGHREIGFVGNIYSTSSIQDRFLGYYRSLLENGIKYNENYLISDRNNAGKLIDLVLPKTLPTAFVCNNDQVAYELIKKMEQKNIKVPQDISVVAFDNTIYSSLCNPKITTVDTNIDELVTVASKVILKKIQFQDKKYSRILVKSSIVNKDSVRKIKK